MLECESFYAASIALPAGLDLNAAFGKSSLSPPVAWGAVFPEPFKAVCIYCERAALVMTQYRGSAMPGLTPLCMEKGRIR